jgi:hypothetical protein
MKKGIAILWLTVLFIAIGVLFWRNDWMYNLPTPVPVDYKMVNAGMAITLPASVKENDKKPLFLHFFNPICPCSRFNMTHFKSLVKEYGKDVNFKIVVLSNESYTVKEIQEKFGIDVPVLFDSTLAVSCGVYSTPQAVIIDTNQQLYYRGNYNRSRFCSDKKTEYARIALDAFLHSHTTAVFDQYALKAYGCQLPKCTKQ